MVSRFAVRFALILMLSVSAGILVAGEVQMSWDASETADGYRVYRGTSSGNYGPGTDVGDQTATTVDGLTDCQMAYLAVKAYNEAGESPASAEVATWPRALLLAATPPVVEQGSSVEWTVTGLNFRSGDAVGFSNPGIAVTGISVDACQSMRVSATISAQAALGVVTMTVTHPSGVAKSATLIQITAPAVPSVVAVSPQSGATNVPASVQPYVLFSEAVGGVTASTVRLLDSGGVAVAQSAASPIVSADGTQVTIVPATPLQAGTTYRISVTGGPGGIVDGDGHPMASSYLQSPGFTTVGDENGPELTGIDVDAVDGTSATVVWETDEPSDSRLYYRKQGGSAYMEVGDNADVTEHALTADGLEPQTTYEYHVSSTDVSGNSSTSSNATFTTTESPFVFLRIEAESGVLEEPVRVTAGPGAFQGKWIDTPAGLDEGTASDPLGSAIYGFHTPVAGSWTLWVRMWGNDGNSDSFYESIDGSTRERLTAGDDDVWIWVRGRNYALGAGQHTLELGGREATARADRLLLTNDPDFVPNEQPDADTTAPLAVTELAAEPGQNLIQLWWQNPTASDLDRVVVRYRTDGSFPLNVADGLPLIDRPATPDALDGVAHEGVVEGPLYRYSVFGVDLLGNVSNPAHVESGIMNPPAAPQNLEVY